MNPNSAIHLTDEQFREWNIQFKDILTEQEACIFLGGMCKKYFRETVCKEVPIFKRSSRVKYVRKSDLEKWQMMQK